MTSRFTNANPNVQACLTEAQPRRMIMDETKVQLLVGLSTYHDPDPRKVYERVTQVLAAHYAGTAMVNLLEGDRLRYYLVVSDIPELCAITTLPLQDTF